MDHPNRSRTARFSLCVDHPEAIRLYADALKRLLARYPEIGSFAFLTQDSGSGFCWVPALYPGLNGHSDCRKRPMSERIAGCLGALHGAAREAGRDIQISLNPVAPRQWMRPSFSLKELRAMLAKLSRGIAVQGGEAPDGPTRGGRGVAGLQRPPAGSDGDDRGRQCGRTPGGALHCAKGIGQHRPSPPPARKHGAPLLDLAPVPEEETIMRLGPQPKDELKRKIDIMNSHWTNYDRLFTAPNP